MSQDMESLVGKVYIDDRSELIDSRAPDSKQSDKQTEVRHSELPEGTRVIGPDTMVTMDYRPDRWNLHVDENNVVKKVKQGWNVGKWL